MEERNESPLAWEDVARELQVKSRKTIAKLVRLGYLRRVPGIDRLLITRESFRAYIAGEALGGQS